MAAGTRLFHLSAALWLAALASAALAQAQIQPPGQGQGPAQVNTIKEAFQKLYGCWKPPPLSVATPMDITVILSFTRKGDILGRPRITYESPKRPIMTGWRTGLPSWRHCNAVRRCHLRMGWGAPLPATPSPSSSVPPIPHARRKHG